jgi:iron complex outermembrane receptor protein
MQLDASVTERLNLRAAATYTDAKYDSFPGAVDYEQVTDPGSPAYGIFINPAVDATDNDMSRSPQFTGSFGANYAVPVSWGQLDFDANLYMTSKFYFDPVNRFYQDAYELLNLRATWTSLSGATEVALYGNNVTDEEYIAEVLPGPFAIQQIYGEPAAYGVQLSFKF